MEYKLAKQLKDAGFPQKAKSEYPLYMCEDDKEPLQIPTLSELIEACGDRFTSLQLEDGTWYTDGITGDILDHEKKGETPEEAVAKLYIKLNK